MWNQIIAMNNLNQKLAESIQKKKALRQQLQKYKQEKEQEKIDELNEWARFQTKSLLDEIELKEKKYMQYPQYLPYPMQSTDISNEGDHTPRFMPRQIQQAPKNKRKKKKSDKNKDNQKQDINEDKEEENKEEIKEDEKDEEKTTKTNEIETTKKVEDKDETNIANIFRSFTKKKIKNEDGDEVTVDGDEDDSDNEDTTTQTNDDNQNAKLEALRKRIEKMKAGNVDGHISFKGLAISLLFINTLKSMVAITRPKAAKEFNRNLLQTLKPYKTLTCNLLKLQSQSVFRSIMRSKMSLISLGGFSIKSFKAIFQKKHKKEDIVLYIRVHVIKLLKCFDEYLKNVPNTVLEFIHNYLICQRPALYQYCFKSENELLSWDSYNCILDYTQNQKKMILINFVAIRCMLIEIIFSAAEKNFVDAPDKKINLYAIASVFYHIIRQYNSKILETEEIIPLDKEIGESVEQFLEDDNTIYKDLYSLIEDGVHIVEIFVDNIMTKITEHIDSQNEKINE